MADMLSLYQHKGNCSLRGSYPQTLKCWSNRKTSGWRSKTWGKLCCSYERVLYLDHTEKVPEEDVNAFNAYYMPHDSVVRESSSTTKLRIVFDASAKTSTESFLLIA